MAGETLVRLLAYAAEMLLEVQLYSLPLRLPHHEKRTLEPMAYQTRSIPYFRKTGSAEAMDIPSSVA
jgi:hypothetical protein